MILCHAAADNRLWPRTNTGCSARSIRRGFDAGICRSGSEDSQGGAREKVVRERLLGDPRGDTADTETGAGGSTGGSHLVEGLRGCERPGPEGRRRR